MHKNEII